MTNVCDALERENADVDRDVAQCAAVLSNRLKMVYEASSITEARLDMSTDQDAGPSVAPKR